MSQKLAIHPEIARLFPRMSAAERAGLKRDIAESGVLVPVVLWRDRKKKQWVIDGANRVQAVEELLADGVTKTKTGAKLEIPTREFVGSELEALEYADAMNGSRRHMSSSQRAACAVTKGVFQRKYQLRTANAKIGLQDREGTVEQVDESGYADRLADESGTNRSYVYDCLKLAKEAPEILARVREGVINIPEARIELERKIASIPANPPEEPEAEPASDEESEPEPTTATAKKSRKKKDEPAKPAPKRPKQTDELGTNVPEHLDEVFSVAPDFYNITRELNNVKSMIEALAKLPGGSQLQVKELQHDIRTISATVAAAAPTVLCPPCKGDDKQCETCSGRGFLTKSQWKAYLKVVGAESQGIFK